MSSPDYRADDLPEGGIITSTSSEATSALKNWQERGVAPCPVETVDLIKQLFDERISMTDEGASTEDCAGANAA